MPALYPTTHPRPHPTTIKNKLFVSLTSRDLGENRGQTLPFVPQPPCPALSYIIKIWKNLIYVYSIYPPAFINNFICWLAWLKYNSYSYSYNESILTMLLLIWKRKFQSDNLAKKLRNDIFWKKSWAKQQNFATVIHFANFASAKIGHPIRNE